MAFTLVGFSESQAAGASYKEILALPDQHVTVQAEDIIVPPELTNIVCAAVIGSNVTAARIVSPSIRAMIPIDVEPLNRDAEPLSPFTGIDLKANPVALTGLEALNVQASNDATAAVRQTALIWLSDGPIAPVTGKIFTVKATSSTTLTAYTWTNGAITFAQDLPAGRYQVVGMRAESAGLIAARLVFPGYSWRPGVIGADAVTDLQDEPFRYGRFGVFGEFDHNRPPTVDFLSASADTSETVYLDLIKIR